MSTVFVHLTLHFVNQLPSSFPFLSSPPSFPSFPLHKAIDSILCLQSPLFESTLIWLRSFPTTDFGILENLEGFSSFILFSPSLDDKSAVSSSFFFFLFSSSLLNFESIDESVEISSIQAHGKAEKVREKKEQCRRLENRRCRARVRVSLSSLISKDYNLLLKS